MNETAGIIIAAILLPIVVVGMYYVIKNRIRKAKEKKKF